MPETPVTPFAFYGSLMSRDGRGSFLSRDTDLGTYGDAVLIRGDLYDVGHFPALRPGNGIVKGQLWTPAPGMEADAFAICDSIEGYHEHEPHRSMYLRRKVRLIDPDIEAWTYVWNMSMIGLAPIPGGDWLGYVRDRQNALEAELAATFGQRVIED